MKKIAYVFLASMLALLVASCKTVDDADTHITHIELAYYNHLAEPIEIKDAEVIETICAYIKQVGGERAKSSKGTYGIPYILTLHYDAGESLVFYLWDESRYSTSLDTDEDGFSYFYMDDVSELHRYIKERYPFEPPTIK